jgi:hypothetical protein
VTVKIAVVLGCDAVYSLVDSYQEEIFASNFRVEEYFPFAPQNRDRRFF